jgi:hypothetical protein
MTTQRNLATALGTAIKGTMNSAEEIHKKIAGVPIDILETALVIDEPLKEVRKVQDGVITSIYTLARGINDEVTRAASKLLTVRTGPERKVTAKVKSAAA